jgi:hypothetical protein
MTINCDNRSCRALEYANFEPSLLNPLGAWEIIRNGFCWRKLYTCAAKKEQGDDFWIHAGLKLPVGQPVFI